MPDNSKHQPPDVDAIIALSKIPDMDKTINKLDNAVYGKNGEPGLLYWSRRNKERLDDINKIMWVILSTGVGAIILEILNLIQTTGNAPSP